MKVTKLLRKKLLPHFIIRKSVHLAPPTTRTTNNNVVDAVQFIGQIGYKLGAVPFEWNLTKDKIKWTDSTHRLQLYYFLGFYTFWNFCFMTVRWAQAICCLNVSYGVIFMNTFNIGTHLGGSFMYLNIYLYKKEFEDFINHLLLDTMNDDEIDANNEELEESPIRNQNKKQQQSSLIKRCILPVYTYCILQFFMSIATLHKNPKYIYYFFNWTGVAKWKLLPIGLFETFISINLGSMQLFNFFILLMYLRSTSTKLDQLLRLNFSNFITMTLKYRQGQIINAQFNLLFRSILLPLMISMLLTFAVTSLYATVKLYHEVKLPGFLAFPFAAIASCSCLFELFPPAYQVNRLSKLIIESNKLNTTRRRLHFKILTSFQPICINVGSYYTILRHTILTFFFVGIDITINLLLTF